MLHCKLYKIKVMRYSNTGVHGVQIEKINNFQIVYTCIPKKISAYHTGSAFTEHYCVFRVSFVLDIKCLK